MQEGMKVRQQGQKPYYLTLHGEVGWGWTGRTVTRIPSSHPKALHFILLRLKGTDLPFGLYLPPWKHKGCAECCLGKLGRSCLMPYPKNLVDTGHRSTAKSLPLLSFFRRLSLRTVK